MVFGNETATGHHSGVAARGSKLRRGGFFGFVCLATVALLSSMQTWTLAAAPASDENPVTTAPAPSAKDREFAVAIKAANSLYDDIRTETLPNGLHVYLKPVPSSPVVTTMVAYRVGSSDEQLDNTGLSHYLEHLMFKGTDKIMPGQIDHITLTNGGQNNAYTTENFTIFHFDFASDRWQLALPIEADRMRNLRIDTKHEFQQEKGAVIAELSRDEDQPWDLEQKTILPILFGPKAPYGHPVIGQAGHVRRATAEIIKAHYDKWYHPNNASLIVCGGFDPDQAMARIKELFSAIPEEKLPARNPPVPIEHTEPIHHEFASKFDVARMIMGFTTIPSTDPDLPALEVCQSVLSGGKTSRFYKDLVEGAEIASSAESFDTWGRYTGWFGVQLELLPGKDRKAAEKLVLAELQQLADTPITSAELARVRQGIISAAVFDRESVHQLADNIAQGVTLNDLEWLKTLLPRIAAVTPADVQRVAKKYLNANQRVVVWSVPQESADHDDKKDDDKKDGVKNDDNKKGGSAKKPEEDKRSDRNLPSPLAGAGPSVRGLRSHIPPASQPHRHADTRHDKFLARLAANPADKPATEGAAEAGAAPASKEFSLHAAKRVELPNGLVLLLWENHRLPIVVAEAHVNDVSLREPAVKAGVASLMGELLDEGTAKHTGEQIAETIEDVGGILSLEASGGSVKVLSNNRSLGLGLLLECLHEPNFPTEAFDREREHQLAAIDDAQRQATERGMMAFRKLIYGKHPFGRSALGTHTTVEKLKPADCAAFHDQLFVPNNMQLVIAGDFNPEEVITEVKFLTADWKKGELPELALPKLEPQTEFVQKFITMPESVQLQFFMGHLGIRRENPDYYKLLVMDFILGTGPGFTDRLSSRLRDREGLAYTVSANISSSAGEEPGVFTCYIGTEAKNFAKVKAQFIEELNRIRSEAPTSDEVSDVQKYLLGQLPFEFTTNAQIAGRLLTVERYHLGFDYLADFRRNVSAVTPADILAMAKKHLDPEHMVLVAAGAIDDHGKPLPKATVPAEEKPVEEESKK